MVTAKAHRKSRATYEGLVVHTQKYLTYPKGLPNQQYGVVLQIPWASPKTIIPENVKVKNAVFTLDENILCAHKIKSNECVGAMVTVKAPGK